MATTVGQHPVSAFTTPRNGDPLDATVVTGNDNTTRVAYVDHDGDAGIHVQSSTLALRQAASVAGAGAKWITADTGDYHLWYSDGTTWHEVSNSTLEIEVLADANLVAGDVVKVTGYNNGQACPTVNKVASASDVAFGIVDAAIGINTKGYIVNTGTVRDVNTNAFSVGTILYPNTSGGLTSTKPTSGNYQPCAYVLRQNTNNGVLYVEFSGPRIVERSDNTASTVVLRDASGNFAAGTITAALSGNATTATTADKVANALTAGSYLTSGGTFDGAAARTFAVDATSANTASKVVARDASGNFSAGTITATFSGNLTGNVTGNVSGSSGSTTGNAATATKLATARNINSVSFDGSADITVAAAAGTLSGTTLASGVTASSLTSVGTLSSLAVSGDVESPITINRATTTTGAAFVKFTNAGGDCYVGPNNSTGSAQLASTAGTTDYALTLVTNSLRPILFAVDEVERGRFTTDGYFKAADGATYDNLSGTYHELRQSATDSVLVISASNSSFVGNGMLMKITRAANSAFDFIECGANTVAQFRVRGDGVIYAQNTTVQSISDGRLKENVTDATEGLNVITALRPVRYDWKAGYGNDRKHQLGFIAQEVEAVFPEAVSAWEMDEPTGAEDENGTPITEKVDYKTVGPGALIPVLVKAIQELEARVAALEA